VLKCHILKITVEQKGKKFLIKAVMHFTALLVLEGGMVRVVSFSIMFYLDHECGKQLFCG